MGKMRFRTIASESVQLDGERSVETLKQGVREKYAHNHHLSKITKYFSRKMSGYGNRARRNAEHLLAILGFLRKQLTVPPVEVVIEGG